MGKGDRKTRKGKIAMGTYGNLRPRKTKSNDVAVSKAKPKAVAKPKAKPKRKTKKTEDS